MSAGLGFLEKDKMTELSWNKKSGDCCCILNKFICAFFIRNVYARSRVVLPHLILCVFIFLCGFNEAVALDGPEVMRKNSNIHRNYLDRSVLYLATDVPVSLSGKIVEFFSTIPAKTETMTEK